MHREHPHDEIAAPADGGCDRGGRPSPDARQRPRGAVWLRSNLRPGATLAGACAAAGVLVPVLAIVVRGGIGPTAWCVAGIGIAAAIATLWIASRHRLVRDGGSLLVRLSPLRVERVPLDVVECFFLGSRLEPPPPGDDTSGGDRVRTLVMRIAERAADHAARPTWTAWGTWREGSVTFDGRWCEPLSVDLARQLNRDLGAAKRTLRCGGGAEAAR